MNKETVHKIAIAQKVVCAFIFLYLLLIPAGIFMPALASAIGEKATNIIAAPFVFIFLIGLLVTWFFLIRMSFLLYGLEVSIIVGILMIVPMIGLIVLLILNSRANSAIKRNGYNTGLLGADLNQFK